MDIAYIAVTVLAALWVGFSAFATLTGASWVVDNLAAYGVPRTWWPRLGAAKAAGAIGLLVGLVVPAVAVAASVGLIVYFLAAVAVVVRTRYFAHVPYPLLYLIPVVAAAALGSAAS